MCPEFGCGPAACGVTRYSVESFIEHAGLLNLDVIDFRTDKGFGSPAGATAGGKTSEVTKEYLQGIKLQCLKKGLSIGYLASIGHFNVATDEEARPLVDAAKADCETALLLGAPLVRCFTSCSGDYTADIQRSRVAVGGAALSTFPD